MRRRESRREKTLIAKGSYQGSLGRDVQLHVFLVGACDEEHGLWVAHDAGHVGKRDLDLVVAEIGADEDDSAVRRLARLGIDIYGIWQGERLDI